MIEGRFPQLDNHLINFLQFSRAHDQDPFKDAYLKSGAPDWQSLDMKKMRNRKAFRHGRLTLLGSAVIMLLPALIFGEAWGVAVLRTINPFSSIQPVSLTHILKVSPGNTTVPQGDSLVLSCTVKGFRGHEVRVDVHAGDADAVTYSLGRIRDADEQQFSHRLAKVSTKLRYRFRAGDSPDSDWFTVTPRPPAVFTGIQLTVTPPPYTKLAPAVVDPRLKTPGIPYGSTITITASSNTPLKTVKLEATEATPVDMTSSSADATRWTADASVTAGNSMRVTATDGFGKSLEEEIPFTLTPDAAPALEIRSPGSRTILPPGEKPRIDFQVSDDYGLGDVVLEEVRADSGEPIRVVKIWPAGDRREMTESWVGEVPAARGQDLAFRITARDQRPDAPNETRSSILSFALPSLADASQGRAKLEAQAVASLQQVIELQKQNIGETTRASEAADKLAEKEWNVVADRQQQIRELTNSLLSNSLKPLGAMIPTVKALYLQEMTAVVAVLRNIPKDDGKRKREEASEAIGLENAILAGLTRAESSFSQSQADRQLAGLSALLEALISGQNGILGKTRNFQEQKAQISKVLTDGQDALSEDFSAFLGTCKKEAEAVRGNDQAFAGTLDQIARHAEQSKIREDMVLAAERLNQNNAAEAISHEETALKNLKELSAMISRVRLEREDSKKDVLLAAVTQASEKLGAIKANYEKQLASMMEVRGASDKSDKDSDALEEEYVKLKKETDKSLLEIPTDLHAFTDLNVANDIVEDVFSIFQEVKQAQGADKNEDRKIADLGYAKEDVELAMMEAAAGRLDDMETWLKNEPDSEKVTTEGFDREEMPESGIATGALATEVEDMIGDLLTENKKKEDEANDGASTHAMPDQAMGHDVMQGDIASFAAKGKSGNQTPDHKEQDGRSNVGRQGMSTGETAAGSGTISEGDKNIEARRTEDPTQSGKVDLKGEADTKATGGGKGASGKADEVGMSGGVKRMDSNEQGSSEGIAAQMSRKADAIYAKASLKNIRVDDLKTAAHHLRQSADAEAKGDIQQLQEQRKAAVTSLRRAQADLQAGPTGAMQVGGSAGVLDDVIESGPDHAPAQYRDQVSDYYKALNDEL